MGMDMANAPLIYAFINAEILDEAYAETTTGHKCNAPVTLAELRKPRVVVVDIDQFLQTAVLGEQKEMMKEQARTNLGEMYRFVGFAAI
ncbi:hypothetical protein NHQ30_003960 [Ciborinia camelliae]|nr:hypothetical protein NHQ30_003960 [Ciborinia camelliae]